MTDHKRYLMFAWEPCGADGRWNAFMGSVADEQEAIARVTAAAQQIAESPDNACGAEGMVMDARTHEAVHQSDIPPKQKEAA